MARPLEGTTLALLKMIRSHVEQTGQFPTNQQIVNGVDGIFSWEVSARLSALVARGYINRTQVTDKGTRKARKYQYTLVSPGEQWKAQVA